jgi:NAD(P)-dependent dehydrogenase (short-subunit alcohol dehydrogenase family)
MIRRTLEGKVAIVTGGGSYLGEAVSRRLGAAGAAVLVAHPLEDEANEVARAIEADGGRALPFVVDTAKKQSTDAMVQTALDWGGKIDIFYQGQYTIGTLKQVVDTTDEEWQSTVDMDLNGVFNMCRAIAPHMIKQRSGSIIITTSGRGIYGQDGFGAYGTSMAGVVGLMKTLQWELGPHNVMVNCFVPGFVVAPRSVKVMGEAKVEALRQAAPHKRLPSPEDIAKFVHFLCDDGDWITGQALMLSTYTDQG